MNQNPLTILVFPFQLFRVQLYCHYKTRLHNETQLVTHIENVYKDI